MAATLSSSSTRRERDRERDRDDVSGGNGNGNGNGKKIRKPYTITKSRESWTDEEHDKFIEALELFDRDWKKIEDFIGSKSVIQIRSHAQKYFLKVQKNGTTAHVPPPRPKRKAVHPYPHKNTNSSSSSSSSSSMLLSNTTTLLFYGGGAADDGSMGGGGGDNHHATGITSTSQLPRQGGGHHHHQQQLINHAVPDFAQVYGFIGSVFDPDTTDHVQKLKEMDPINFETVLLLMRNLTINLSNPDFDPIDGE